MVRFYGLTPSQIKNLDAITAKELWLAITPIEAQEILNAMMVSAYPHMKSEKAKEVSRKVQKQAKIESSEAQSKTLSNEDLAQFLRGTLGG